LLSWDWKCDVEWGVTNHVPVERGVCAAVVGVDVTGRIRLDRIEVSNVGEGIGIVPEERTARGRLVLV
jgi:hypothetical protein